MKDFLFITFFIIITFGIILSGISIGVSIVENNQNNNPYYQELMKRNK